MAVILAFLRLLVAVSRFLFNHVRLAAAFPFPIARSAIESFILSTLISPSLRHRSCLFTPIGQRIGQGFSPSSRRGRGAVYREKAAAGPPFHSSSLPSSFPSSYSAMGAVYEDAFPLSQRATAPVFQDRRHTKVLFDNVHRNIYVDPLSLKFIDTEQFQRLRDVKQLGMCHMVFPGAVHTRFEHSLGVYWLAGQAVQRLSQYQGDELGIERSDIVTVRLAGLLHDVGHGPFSHVFENEFLPRVLPGGVKWSHENMSRAMVDYIVDQHNIDIDAGDLRRVKDMIVASSRMSHAQITSEKQFLYDIVANGRNSIDVDNYISPCSQPGSWCH